jgi:P27 family predicted phage terminase small subunit
MRGRKPTPSYLKEINGNPGKRPLNTRAPRPDIRAPSCPRELSPVAKREWRRLARQLMMLRLVTDLDRAILAAYCQAFALWAEAVGAIRKFGTMVKSPSGYPMQSPYVAVANKQAELMIRIAAEFGFSPSSRSRIALPTPSLHDLPAARYLGRGGQTDDSDYITRRYFR